MSTTQLTKVEVIDVSLIALNIGEAAQEVGISREALEGMIVLGKGPKTHRVGRRAFILRKDYETWLRRCPTTDLTDLNIEPSAGDRP